MKKVIISFVWAVGMKHWGPGELQVGSVYYGNHEITNPKDSNAVAVCEEKNCRRTLAYLRRGDASIIAPLFKANLIEGHCYLKAKSAVEVYKYRTGPQQKLNVGFLCKECNVEHLQKLLAGHNVHVRIF